MNRPDTPTPSPQPKSNAFWLLLAVVGPLVLWLMWEPFVTVRPYGVRLIYDPHEIAVYHATSEWVDGEGVLYRNYISEYPPVANVLFAGVRLISDVVSPFPPGLASFAWVWISLSWLMYLGIVRFAMRELPRQSIWIWLNPVTLYFTLFRFDIAPAVLTLLALCAARRDDHFTAARLLGLAIAIKGYPMWVVPPFAVFVWQRAGFRKAVAVAVVCGIPMLVASLAVWAFVGWDGMLMPYKIQMSRALDTSASTYDVLSSIGFSGALRIGEYPSLVRAFQLGAALIAAGLLPRTFPQLCEACLVAVLGLLSASMFYSPQFVVWLLPFAAFSNSRLVCGLMLLMLVATYVFFPVGYDLQNDTLSLVSVAVLCLLRFVLLGVCLTRLYQSRFGKQAEATVC